ncbi:hypothetical protein [Arcicella rigui]|uniref:Transmembrane protein n=1 Tax=Arcicella rigui TaxID=797020 RepID=A0ABU5Q4X1_9BACT|nr:hypothetical protein [Arcicella rigui]MEA5137702.1 hypothetical protein [Arcicella rigui]
MEIELHKDQQTVIRGIGFYQAVGGFTGCGLAAYQLLQAEINNLSIAILYLYCFGVSIFSIYAGLLLLEGNHKKGLPFSLVTQVLQLLNFTLSGVTLKFVSGVMLSIGFSFTDVFKLISDFSLEENSLNFNPNDNSVVISVNIIALILVCLINKVYNEIEEQEILLEEEDSQMYY